ncbi:MAG: hypothetical protein R3A48_25140 [Polyangiales bacterium]
MKRPRQGGEIGGIEVLIRAVEQEHRRGGCVVGRFHDRACQLFGIDAMKDRESFKRAGVVPLFGAGELLQPESSPLGARAPRESAEFAE